MNFKHVTLVLLSLALLHCGDRAADPVSGAAGAGGAPAGSAGSAGEGGNAGGSSGVGGAAPKPFPAGKCSGSPLLCDLRNGNGCASNEICRFGQTSPSVAVGAYCAPAAQNGTGGLLAPCDNVKMQCKAGLTCNSDPKNGNYCLEYCCEDSDCASANCIQVAPSAGIKLGVCYPQ